MPLARRVGGASPTGDNGAVRRRNQLLAGIAGAVIIGLGVVGVASSDGGSSDTAPDGPAAPALEDPGAQPGDRAPDQPPGPVDVEDHGADGSDDSVDTDAIRRALDADHDGIVRFGPGTFLLDGSIDLPDDVVEVRLDDDTVVRQTVDAPAFVRRGEVLGEPIGASGADRGSDRIETRTDGIRPGDWVVVATSRVVERNKAFRLGSLRQATGVDGGSVGLDRALVRDLTADTEVFRMSLAPPVSIRGGTVEQAEPLNSFAPLVLFEWAEAPELDGVELRDCGGSGVKLVGTVGGRLDVFVHDCVDDHAGKRFDAGRHYGYGVEVTGPTRDLAVTGRATAVRHAFTTNGSFPIADDRLVNVGEPEQVDVSLDVWDTTSSGLDTHEIGHRIRFHDCRVVDAGRYQREGSRDGKEGGFGIFVRAPGTIIDNCEIVGSSVSGLVVASPSPGIPAWSPREAATVAGTRIVDTRGRTAVQLKQPAVLRDVEIVGSHRFGIRFERDGENSEVTGSLIDLAGEETTFAFVNPGRATVQGNDVRTDQREFG